MRQCSKIVIFLFESKEVDQVLPFHRRVKGLLCEPCMPRQGREQSRHKARLSKTVSLDPGT